MMNRNRGFAYALGRLTLSNEEEINAQPLDVEINLSNPETLAALSLSEYVQLLKNQHEQEGVTAEIATESFSDHWQNFKNRFESEMANEDAYVDKLLKSFKALRDHVQAANDRLDDSVPISVFANTYWLQKGDKPMANIQQITHEMERLLEINTLVDKAYLPNFAAEIKYAMDVIATATTNIPKAVEKAYVINKAVPNTAFDKIINKPTTIKAGGGKTYEGFESEPFLGSWVFKRWNLVDRLERKVDRGQEIFCEALDTRARPRIQLKPGSRQELLKLIDVAIKTLTTIDGYLDRLLAAERAMLVDKIMAFERSHANWSKYPENERSDIVVILLAVDNCLDRNMVMQYVINGTRKACRAIERYIEMNAKRLR